MWSCDHCLDEVCGHVIIVWVGVWSCDHCLGEVCGHVTIVWMRCVVM